MKMMKHSLIASAVLASALATFGCNATMFTQANDTLKTVRSAGSAVGNVRIPTAAIATALGGIELVKALSSDGAEAKSSGIIAAGSGNIIAAGSGNFQLLELKLDQEIKREINERGVKATAIYTSKLDAANFTLSSAIKSFVGDSQGYDIEFGAANFAYKFASAGNAPGNVSFSLGKPGTLKKKGSDFVVTVKELAFTTIDPLPQDATNIGTFAVEALDNGEKVEMVAKIGVKAGKIQASATITSTENGKSVVKSVNFGEDNPSFTEAEVDAAAQKEKDDKAAAGTNN